MNAIQRVLDRLWLSLLQLRNPVRSTAPERREWPAGRPGDNGSDQPPAKALDARQTWLERVANVPAEAWVGRTETSVEGRGAAASESRPRGIDTSTREISGPIAARVALPADTAAAAEPRRPGEGRGRRWLPSWHGTTQSTAASTRQSGPVAPADPLPAMYDTVGGGAPPSAAQHPRWSADATPGGHGRRADASRHAGEAGTVGRFTPRLPPAPLRTWWLRRRDEIASKRAPDAFSTPTDSARNAQPAHAETAMRAPAAVASTHAALSERHFDGAARSTVRDRADEHRRGDADAHAHRPAAPTPTSTPTPTHRSDHNGSHERSTTDPRPTADQSALTAAAARRPAPFAAATRAISPTVEARIGPFPEASPSRWPELPPWPGPADAEDRNADRHALLRLHRLELEQRG